MSNTLTPSGLQSSAGLYGSCGVYQFDRNGAIFNPLDLNPYLLFDAESSMIGTLENPTLDLDPTKQESLDVITATRAGTATFVNLDGEIEIAQPNTVRVDSSLGYPAILVEPSSENLLPYSEDFDAGNWENVSLGTGSNPIVTSDYATSPDGTQNASRIQFDKGSGTAGTDLSILRYNFSITNGLTLSKSVYLKSNTADTYNLVLHDSADASGTNVKKLTVTPEWQRFDVYGVAPGTSTGISFGLRNINVTGVSNTADVLVWGAQVEAGSVATSLIPTSGSTVTRAADNLEISGSAFDFYNQSEGTIYIELNSEDDGKNSYPVYFTQDIAGYAERNNGTWAIQKDGAPSFYLASWANGGFVSDALINLGGYTAGDLTRVSVSYNSNSYEGSKDGASVQTSTPTTMATTLVDRLFVGGSGIFQNSSRIKRLIYWPVNSERL